VITWQHLMDFTGGELSSYLVGRKYRVIDQTDHALIEVPRLNDCFDLELVFDETNAAIGEDWYWGLHYYYFLREADAVWFTMRWS
jgi:hypothetical protein